MEPNARSSPAIAAPNAGEIVLGCFAATHIGDVLCVSPLPRLLSQQRGLKVYVNDHHNMYDIFRENPYIAGFSKATTLSLRVCATGNGHVLQRFMQAFELPVDPLPKPEVYLTAAEREWAKQERLKWPTDRPVCLLSCGVVTDKDIMDKVNWAKIAATLSKRYTIIQPVLRERPFRGTVSYRKLTLRQYISLFTVVDNFVGGTSAGSHIAAAFDVPAMIVIWKSLEQGLAFPISGQGFKASFLYPQHWFIAAEDVSHLHFDQVRLERTLDNLMRHGKQGRPTSIGNHPRWPCGFTPRPPARIANVNGRRLGRIPTAYGDSVAEGEQVWPVGVPIEPSPSPELKAPAMRGPKKAAIIQQADANAVLPSAKPSSTHDEPPSS